MATITFRRGDSAIWTFTPDDGSGQPVDLTGAAAHVEVHTGAACLRLPLTRVGAGFDWRMDDQTMPDLPAGAYRASFGIQWPDGLRDRDDFALVVEEGCL